MTARNAGFREPRGNFRSEDARSSGWADPSATHQSPVAATLVTRVFGSRRGARARVRGSGRCHVGVFVMVRRQRRRRRSANIIRGIIWTTRGRILFHARRTWRFRAPIWFTVVVGSAETDGRPFTVMAARAVPARRRTSPVVVVHRISAMGRARSVWIAIGITRVAIVGA